MCDLHIKGVISKNMDGRGSVDLGAGWRGGVRGWRFSFTVIIKFYIYNFKSKFCMIHTN